MINYRKCKKTKTASADYLHAVCFSTVSWIEPVS